MIEPFLQVLTAQCSTVVVWFDIFTRLYSVHVSVQQSNGVVTIRSLQSSWFPLRVQCGRLRKRVAVVGRESVNRCNNADGLQWTKGGGERHLISGLNCAVRLAWWPCSHKGASVYGKSRRHKSSGRYHPFIISSNYYFFKNTIVLFIPLFSLKPSLHSQLPFSHRRHCPFPTVLIAPCM